MTSLSTHSTLSDPEQRMILALLNSADPLGLLDGGSPPDVYAASAVTIAEELRQGGGIDELLVLFMDAGDRLPLVDAFVRAVTTWWDVDLPSRWEAAVSAAV